MARRSNLLRQIGLLVIVGLIVLAFVFVFGQPSVQRSNDSVADVDGEPVTRAEWNQQRQRLAQRMPADPDNEAMMRQLDALALEQAIQMQVMAQEAQRLGIRVHDEEIATEICELPIFANGCDAELVSQIVRRSGFSSEREYTDWVRREMLVRKLARLLASTVRVSSESARESLLRDRTELRLRYAVARATAFQDQVEVDEEAARALAEGEPERIAAAYERRQDEFRRPERIRARHMLFRGETALERARDTLQKLEAGADFVALAGELSDDEATRALGGDLGTFARGRMQPAFEEAAFGAEPRSVVGPVETESGVHLIRVEEKLPALDRKLEDVRLELARDLLREDRAASAARAAAEKMAALLAEGRDFDTAAFEAGLQMDETLYFRASAPLIPGIGRVGGLRAAALRLSPEEPVSRDVFGESDAFYLISLADRRVPEEDALIADLESYREQLELAARDRVMLSLFERRLEELQNDGRLRRYPLLVN